MEKVEYEIKKDKDFIGQRYDTYTIEKKITQDNGETEIRTRTFIPMRDGDIKEVNLDELDFPATMTNEDWEKMTPEQKYAWLGIKCTNNMNIKIADENKTDLSEDIIRIYKPKEIESINYIFGKTIY